MFEMDVKLTIFLVFSTITITQCSRIRAAPYYMPLDNEPPDIEEAIKASGIKEFIFSFILAPKSGGCVPTWDGIDEQKVSEDTEILKKVKAVRALGGDIAISFGGYTGVELGSSKACSDPQELADAYQSVIDKYDLTNMDLDIEGDDLGDIEGENKRFKAIAILKERAKSKGKDLFVSLTMPSTTVGLSELGKYEIQRAIDNKVVIDLYKIMAFDYGGQGSDQSSSVIDVMEKVHQNLKQLRPDLTEAQVYASTGMILMNGHTDQASELYSLNTFEELINYANDKSLGRVSFWALNRDRPCGEEHVGWVSGFCSSIEQNPYDFSKILAKFGSNVPTTTTPKPTTRATPVPTTHPTPKPTTRATPVPTTHPTPKPTTRATPVPTTHPTPKPTTHATPVPTTHPTPKPTTRATPVPTTHPTPKPTTHTTPVPTTNSTPKPTTHTTPVPTTHPTPKPTTHTTPVPTTHPTPRPTTHTTHVPTTGTPPETTTQHRVTVGPVIDGVDCRQHSDNEYFPYKNDCHEYIRCYNKLAHLEYCALGTIYDNKLHLCNWPKDVDRPECK